MTTIDSLAATAAAVPPQDTLKDKPKTVIGSDFETFLKMLTTQMKNQDPLNPMEASDFAVQLATFSSVEQQVLTNNILSGLSDQMGQMGMAQLASWVGMQARAPMSVQFEGFPVTLHSKAVPLADKAQLKVMDANGQVVQTIGMSLSGEPVQWTGRDATGFSLPFGEYQFEVESLNEGTVIDTQIPEVYDTVVEARMEAGQTVLVMQSGAQVGAGLITALRN